MINVNIIRIYTGPLHARLEAIWERFASLHSDRMNLHVFDNTKGNRRHAEALEEIWKKEKDRPEEAAIITEFDFLPDPTFLDQTHDSPIEAATYCTRDRYTRQLSCYGRPGPWYLRFDKKLLSVYFNRGKPPGGLEKLNGAFSDGGVPPDPCGRFFKTIPAVHLLGTEDCYPEHFGVRVVGKGEHLFFSRHYNDPPAGRVAGFALSDILLLVERRIKKYEQKEKAATRRDGAMPPPSLVAATDPKADL